MSNDPVVALPALSVVFESLGRILVCLDGDFRIAHSSASLTDFASGTPIADLFGSDLFGPGASLRSALEAGERREGQRAFMRYGDGLRLFSITAAPLPDATASARMRYMVVLRPDGDEYESGAIWLAGLLARAPAMQAVFKLIEKLQGSAATILLTGERGSGKQAVARVIHEHSPRRKGPFVVVNCAFAPDLLAGAFEPSAKGTLFLDEAGNLPLSLQDRLLGMLHERTFARVIAATQVDLRKAVRAGKFREDLYNALRVVPVDIPPLRARREDIEPLAHLFLARAGQRQRCFAPETMRRLLDYEWPGNVRELENAIQYAVVVGKGPAILPEDLPPEVTPAMSGVVNEEANRIRAALESVQWRRAPAAASLRMSRTTLWRKMREHGLASGVSRSFR